MGELQGKVAVVLGASATGNMGQAIARRFLLEGARVVAAGRKREPLEAFAAEVGCAWTLCDITRKRDIDALAALAVQRYGGIDIAVNAAAVALSRPFEQTTGEDIDLMTGVLFKGSFQFMQAMVREMKRGGSIVMISSAVATVQFDDEAAYAGAKAGMERVVRSVANEYGARGIRANVIAPGLTVTPMTDGFTDIPGVVDAFAREVPLGRIGTADDVAAAAVFLARDDCFMTGQTLQVNGGLTLRRNPTMAEVQASMVAVAT
jgi:2-hydroxycyclohexanecarboxyl-CoA dehydrogenase